MLKFNTIEEALEDLRQGKITLVTDDPDRENEGDFICAAEFATKENINFMAKDLFVCPCPDIMQKSLCSLKWYPITQTITTQPLPFPLTM